jgi:Predicted periplasmic ligand-binding sensor domain
MRFDGKRVDVYDRSTIPFLSTDSFYGVYEDRNGALWFAAQGSGLIKFSNNTFESIDPEGKILPKSIRCILLDQDGSIWIGSNNEGLFRRSSDGAITKVDFPEMNGVGILDFTKATDNSLWIATDGNGVVKFKDKKFEHLTTRDGLLSNTIDAILGATNGDVWIGTTNGMNLFSNGNLSKVKPLENFQINEIIQDERNIIWVGSEMGLGASGSTTKWV